MMKWPFALVLAAALATISPATAQVYPSRPITMVVPFPPGGAFDTIGRLMAERMKTSLGQPVIVENGGGANGSIGVGRVARASADGYTLVLGYWGTHVVNAAIYVLQYDVQTDFEPISLVVANPQVIVSKNALPAKDLRGLVGWLEANPDKGTLATVGSGSPPHIAGLFFQKLTETRFQFVPYRGGAPAMQDLVAGQVDLSILQAALAPGASRKDQGICCHRQDPPELGVRHSDHGRGGRAGASRYHVVRAVGAQGHAQDHCRQAQCRGRGCARRSGRSSTACRDRAGDIPARAANPGGACRSSEGRDRDVVADHQGSGD